MATHSIPARARDLPHRKETSPARARSKWNSAKTLWKKDIVPMRIDADSPMASKNYVPRTPMEIVNYIAQDAARSSTRNMSANSENAATSCTRIERSARLLTTMAGLLEKPSGSTSARLASRPIHQESIPPSSWGCCMRRDTVIVIFDINLTNHHF